MNLLKDKHGLLKDKPEHPGVLLESDLRMYSAVSRTFSNRFMLLFCCGFIISEEDSIFIS